MAPFATAEHLASWIGVCPGVNESACVNKSGHTRHGNAALKRILGMAAMAAIKQNNLLRGLLPPHRRPPRPPPRPVAVMHKLAIAVWYVLADKATYRDLGPTTTPAAIPSAPCTTSSNKPTLSA